MVVFALSYRNAKEMYVKSVSYRARKGANRRYDQYPSVLLVLADNLNVQIS